MIEKQLDRIVPAKPERHFRGPRFKPLRRAVKVPVWGDFFIRIGLALGDTASLTIGVLTGLAVRGLAIIYNWSLPHFGAREL